jgi:PAS domain S-box-containing protein
MVDPKRVEEQFQALFEAAPNGIIAVDANGRIVLLNAQAEKMFGYSREELIGQPVEVLIPERFRHGHVHLRESAAGQARPMGAGRDICGVCKDGSELPLEIGLTPVRRSTGDVTIATVVDITERKRAEEQRLLFERAQTLVDVFQQLGITAAVLQSDGRVLLPAPLFEKLRSHFVFSGDRIKLSNARANNLFMQALASLNVESIQTVHSIPCPAENEHAALMVYLLPMKSTAAVLGILIVTALDAEAPLSPALVQSLFGLTPGEARLAALIGTGLPLWKAAMQLGISGQSARTVLKRVFSKVGVSRQSELAALLGKLHV